MKALLFPGQGSQFKGMGRDLFSAFPQLVQQANETLGYDIEDLCINDRSGQLTDTRYAQPAIFVVNALAAHAAAARSVSAPTVYAGHSLGEYNALFAAGVIDWETGLRLVKKRGELMSLAEDGGMAAIMGIAPREIDELLRIHELVDVDIANYNTPTQTVISGPRDSIKKAEKIFGEAGARVVILRVSGAFHSRYMRVSAAAFEQALNGVVFQPPKHIVIANVNARPYQYERIGANLVNQIFRSVHWVQSVLYMLDAGVTEFGEVSGTVLSDMVRVIRRSAAMIRDAYPAVPDGVEEVTPDGSSESSKKPFSEDAHAGKKSTYLAQRLGSQGFKDRYGLRYSYIAGSMYKGISSVALVEKMAKAGMIGYYGAGGEGISEVSAAIGRLKSELGGRAPWGVNLIHNMDDEGAEWKIVEALLEADVRYVEASAFLRVTKALVLYRVRGLSLDAGRVQVGNHVLGKCSRPEVAEKFMSPPPEEMLEELLHEGAISREQYDLAKAVPVSSEVCVEGDSGGHTDMRVLTTLYPSIIALRNRLIKTYNYSMPIYVGVAGGLGSPDAVGSAFMLGADFVVTGSINQCTVESGQSDIAKDMLLQIDIQDTDYAPAGDMFDLGARVQVLKKGVFFPARANQLYQLYKHHHSLDEIPRDVRERIETKIFKQPIDRVWEHCCDYYRKNHREDVINAAEKDSRKKMALVFKYYFSQSTQYARAGNAEFKTDFQIHTGPALGAFNQWAKGGPFEDWRRRHVDVIAIALMEGAANRIVARLIEQGFHNDAA